MTRMVRALVLGMMVMILAIGAASPAEASCLRLFGAAPVNSLINKGERHIANALDRIHEPDELEARISRFRELLASIPQPTDEAKSSNQGAVAYEAALAEKADALMALGVKQATALKLVRDISGRSEAGRSILRFWTRYEANTRREYRGMLRDLEAEGYSRRMAKAIAVVSTLFLTGTTSLSGTAAFLGVVPFWIAWTPIYRVEGKAIFLLHLYGRKLGRVAYEVFNRRWPNASELETSPTTAEASETSREPTRDDMPIIAKTVASFMDSAQKRRTAALFTLMTLFTFSQLRGLPHKPDLEQVLTVSMTRTAQLRASETELLDQAAE